MSDACPVCDGSGELLGEVCPLCDGDAGNPPPCSALTPMASCGECEKLLSVGYGWWHKAGFGSDLCAHHYWQLGRAQRRPFSTVEAPSALGGDAGRYTDRFGAEWWGGRGSPVAVLCGGGTYFFEHGGQMQACDETCVESTEAVLRYAGFSIARVDVSDLGNAGGAGDAARAALASCRCAVVPGGHDVPQAKALGQLGKAALEGVLERGGGLVGICAGAWLLSHGDGQPHNFCWLPVHCDPDFGDSGLAGAVPLSASQGGAALFGPGLRGRVVFDESPGLLLSGGPGAAGSVTVDATYAAPVSAVDPCGLEAARRMGGRVEGLVGEAAVVHGYRAQGEAGDGKAPSGRIVLIGPHFELTDGVAKGHVIARAVAWAIGRDSETVRS